MIIFIIGVLVLYIIWFVFGFFYLHNQIKALNKHLIDVIKDVEEIKVEFDEEINTLSRDVDTRICAHGANIRNLIAGLLENKKYKRGWLKFKKSLDDCFEKIDSFHIYSEEIEFHKEN